MVHGCWLPIICPFPQPYLAVGGEGGLQQPWHTNFPLWIFTPNGRFLVAKNPHQVGPQGALLRSQLTFLLFFQTPKKIKHQMLDKRKAQNLKLFFWYKKHQKSKLPQHAVKPLSSKKPPMKICQVAGLFAGHRGQKPSPWDSSLCLHFHHPPGDLEL